MHLAFCSAVTHPIARLRTTWLLAVLLAAALPAHATKPPKVQWTKTFAGWGTAYGECVQQTADDGYIVAGVTDSSDGPLRMAILLAKVDSLGATEWQRIIRAGGTIEANSVVQTADGGYALTGMATLKDGAPGRVYLVKTDAQGELLWWRAVNNIAFARGYSLEQMDDRGFAIIAQWPVRDSGLLLYRTDSLGNCQWWRQYPVAYPSCMPCPVCLRRTSDRGFIIGARTLLKVDSLGNQEWHKSFEDIAGVNSVLQMPDGGYVAAGPTQTYSNTYLDEVDSLGNREWGQWYPDDTYACWVEQTTNNGFVLAGSVGPVDSSWAEAMLMRTSPNGTRLWTKTLCIGGATCVRLTKDGGYIVAGTRDSGPSGHQIFLTKLAPDRTR